MKLRKNEIVKVNNETFKVVYALAQNAKNGQYLLVGINNTRGVLDIIDGIATIKTKGNNVSPATIERTKKARKVNMNTCPPQTFYAAKMQELENLSK